AMSRKYMAKKLLASSRGLARVSRSRGPDWGGSVPRARRRPTRGALDRFGALVAGTRIAFLVDVAAIALLLRRTWRRKVCCQAPRNYSRARAFIPPGPYPLEITADLHPATSATRCVARPGR